LGIYNGKRREVKKKRNGRIQEPEASRQEECKGDSTETPGWRKNGVLEYRSDGVLGRRKDGIVEEWKGEEDRIQESRTMERWNHV
jgi:hypothetical protein